MLKTKNIEIEKLVDCLTLEEKAALIAGTDFMYTNPIPRLNIPSLCMSDGPHGLRKQADRYDNGITESLPSTAFPTASLIASGWNAENARKTGAAIAEECRHYGVDVLLGPAVNVKRNPLCGRNFEYFSEDPLLAAEMAAGEIDGIQQHGVGACVKHFALNNSENFRIMGNSVADMRAMREIYLSVFERIVKKSKPFAVMSAYNQINGGFCSENAWLLKDVLRGEWGFDGTVITDWGAMNDRVAAVKAGLDIEMPGDTKICRQKVIKGVESGNLSQADLDDCIRNILKLIYKCMQKTPDSEADFRAHHALAAEIAEDCAVLMKNDGILPLKKDEKYCIAGGLFENMRYQGAGSSMINPTEVTSPKQAFEERAVKFELVRGYALNNDVSDQKLIDEAIEISKPYDKIIVFAGLTDNAESEGGDREHMRLPQNQLDLIDALAETGKKIVIALYGGAAVELPFADKVSAILNMLLPGQNGGTATANLLFGDKTPCGKLAETYVKSYADVPFGEEFGKTVNEIYKESVFVGYRYYLTAGKQVAFPFGFGLSYTQFEYNDMRTERCGDEITVSCGIKNIGSCDGAEIAQLYVKAPKTDVFKPEKELRAFTKVYLKAGESKRAVMKFDVKDLRYFNVKENRRVLEGGAYGLQICSDCLTVKLKDEIEIKGEEISCPYTERVADVYKSAQLQGVSDEIFEEMSGLKVPALPPKLPITLESPFTDLRQTALGRLLYAAVMSVPDRLLKKANKLPDGAEKENRIKGARFMKKILQSNCLRSMSMCSTLFPYNFAQGFELLSNGHILGAIKKFCSKIKVSPLPKDQNNSQKRTH